MFTKGRCVMIWQYILVYILLGLSIILISISFILIHEGCRALIKILQEKIPLGVSQERALSRIKLGSHLLDASLVILILAAITTPIVLYHTTSIP